MLVIGYPTTLAQAATLIGLHPKSTNEHIQDELHRYNIGLYYIYRDTWAIGTSIYELTPQAGNFHQFDDGLEIIMAYKRSIMSKFKQANINLDEIHIVPERNATPVLMKNPEPYLIKLS